MRPIPRRSAGLVRPPPPRAAVARAHGRARRPVPRLAVGDHAAADDGEGGRALLRALPARWPTVERAGRGAARRRAARLGRAWLLRAGAQPARLRAGGGRAHGGDFPRHRSGAARAARHRRLHRGGDRRDRLRRAARCRSTAMSSGWWRGCSPSRTNCRRRSRRSSDWRRAAAAAAAPAISRRR